MLLGCTAAALIFGSKSLPHIIMFFYIHNHSCHHHHHHLHHHRNHHPHHHHKVAITCDWLPGAHSAPPSQPLQHQHCCRPHSHRSVSVIVSVFVFVFVLVFTFVFVFERAGAVRYQRWPHCESIVGDVTNIFNPLCPSGRNRIVGAEHFIVHCPL